MIFFLYVEELTFLIKIANQLNNHIIIYIRNTV